MKLRKILFLAVLGLFVFSGFAFAVPVEDALSPQPDESVYIVLRLSNTGNLLRWVLSPENIDVFMPLILASESSNEIIGGLEIARALIGNLPVEALALTAGVTKSGMPFLQSAFTVNSSLAPVVRKIKAGNADSKDIAKLLLGENNPLGSIAESMIKVERDGDKYIVDNELVLKAEGDLLLLSISPEEINKSIEALDKPEARLFTKAARKFNTEDFVFVHVDKDTAKTLDDSKELVDDADIDKYLDKPLNVELAFRRTPDKFVTALGLNLREALKPKYVARYFKASELVTAKGGYINLDMAGGSKSPLFAFGGCFNVDGLTESRTLKSLWDGALKDLKRFKITEEDLVNVLNGSISLVVNDSLTIQGVKLPAIFFSTTGTKGAAGKIFDKFAQSAHLSRLQDNILQVDSSLSPVPCLISNNNDTLGVSMAEITSFADKPQPSGALADLMKRDAVSAIVIDFAGIQSWINDNGVLTLLAPMATMMGYGKYAEYARDILGAKFSVPSFALWAESPEIIYTEFAIEDVRPEDGILSRLVKIGREFMPPVKSESKSEEKSDSEAK